MLWILIALIGCYAVFVIGPAVAGVCTIFKALPGSPLERMLEPDAQLYPFRERILAVKERLDTLPKVPVSIRAKDGVVLSGVYYDLGKPRTAIFVHGYRTQPEVNFTEQAEAFSRHGCNLLLIRQRGHEPGSHVRCGMGLKERHDISAWNDWALSQNGVAETVLYGVSMGAAAVGFAASLVDPACTKALILDCGFRSPYEQISLDCKRHHIPPFVLMPWIRLFARIFLKLDIRERTDAALRETTIPCFFLHGTKDLTVPYEIGRAVFEACGAEKAFFTAENAGHAESYLSDPDRAEDEIFTFLGEERTERN